MSHQELGHLFCRGQVHNGDKVGHFCQPVNHNKGYSVSTRHRDLDYDIQGNGYPESSLGLERHLGAERFQAWHLGVGTCITGTNISVNCCVHSGPPKGVGGQTEGLKVTQMAC